MDDANKLIFVKKYDEANKQLQASLNDKIDEESLIAHHRYIELNIKLQKSQEVMQRYDGLYQKNPTNPLTKSLHIIASLFTNTIDSEKALELIESFLSDHDNNVLISYTFAYALEEQDKVKEAIIEYEKCIYLDPTWYPAYFGLSQVYYKAGNKEKGDQYFYMFEEHSPYSVYGNFDTHLKLMQEYLSQNRFDEAVEAVKTLKEWWVDNKKYCPIEIQIFQALSLSVIEEQKPNSNDIQIYKQKYNDLSAQVLAQKNIDPQTLYFIAKVLENFGQKEQAIKFYQHSLKSDLSDPDMIQKIGADFFSKGDYESAGQLFEEAYKTHPHNDEIRFCRLVCKLKDASANIEEYLLGKERLKKLLHTNNNPTEILALLHGLYSKFEHDSEVNYQLGEIYLKLQNVPKAKEHFEKMYQDDKQYVQTQLNYANFLVDINEHEAASPIIIGIEDKKHDHQISKDILWLKARLAYSATDYREASKLSKKLADFDPWNIQYLVLETLSGSQMQKPNGVQIDKGLLALYSDKESQINWSAFLKKTMSLKPKKKYELIYLREKIYFLFTQGSKESIKSFLEAAVDFDPMRGSTELIRLVNTNFDHPNIYFSLGILAKKQWLLETSTMWLNQCLHQANLMETNSNQELRADVYLEMADNLVWSKQQPQKAIEYAKLAMELGHSDSTISYTILAHAYILLGQMGEARTFLSRLDHRKNLEAVFFSGLVHYRDGSIAQAKKVWKPLLSINASDLKLHRLKTELMQYYYDEERLLKQNVS